MSKKRGRFVEAIEAVNTFTKKGANLTDSVRLALLVIKEGHTEEDLKKFFTELEKAGFKVDMSTIRFDLETGKRHNKVKILKNGIELMQFKCVSIPQN